MRVGDDEHVKLTCWSAPGVDKPTFKEAMAQLATNAARPIKVGHSFGPTWTNHWVKVQLKIPESFVKARQDVLCESDLTPRVNLPC